MKNREIKALPRAAYRIAFKLLLRSYAQYQPIYLGGKLINHSKRPCLDRWQLIKPELDHYQPRNLLDLGSAEGFYTQQAAAENNLLAIGVEVDERRLRVATEVALADKEAKSGWLKGPVTLDFVDQLPSWDLVLCLSLFHHLWAEHGEEYSKKLLSQLRSKIKLALIFEMGQSNEQGYDWSTKLPLMGDDPHHWIEQLLVETGYHSIRKIGLVDAYQSQIKRAIFVAEP
ncbi:MAG: class I SAM-dependent methyltransferase [Patescibacteria group bacterium]